MKKIVSITLLFALALICAVPAFASAGDTTVTPYYNNVTRLTNSFSIDENGLATISFGYTGRSGVTTGGTIDIVLKDANGNTVEDWSFTSTSYRYNNSVTYQLTASGSYTAEINYVISGSGGADDSISKTLTDTY